MALAYDAARVTRDVDAVFKPHGIVLEEARKVADDLGLPYWWLNEPASGCISGKDPAPVRDPPQSAPAAPLAPLRRPR